MRILGIESSCDETGVAVFDDEKGLVGHVLHTQIAMHAEYGGVVPELASRDHIKRVVPLVREVLAQSETSMHDLCAVAYTAGPGLIGALLVGATEARALAYALNIPAVPVHHMEGHLLAPMLEDPAPTFPFVALLISGGHTMLIKVEKPGSYELLGQSVDDAAGEAFDKTAKLLGIPYPGGPGLEKLAQKGNSKAYHFPSPMLDRPNCDFSFAGLKTAVLNAVHASTDLEKQKGDIARREFCTDNGAMIALAGMMRFKAGQIGTLGVDVFPRWPLDSLKAL